MQKTGLVDLTFTCLLYPNRYSLRKFNIYDWMLFWDKERKNCDWLRNLLCPDRSFCHWIWWSSLILHGRKCILPFSVTWLLSIGLFQLFPSNQGLMFASCLMWRYVCVCVFRTPQCCVLLNTWCVSYTGSSRPLGATGMKGREKAQDPSTVKVDNTHIWFF